MARPEDIRKFNEFIDKVIARIDEVRKKAIKKDNVCGFWIIKGFLDRVLERL